MMDKETLEAIRQIVNEAVKPLGEGINKLGERVGGLEEKVGGLEKEVGGLKERIGGLEERVSRLEEEVSDLKDYERGTRVLIESKVEPQIQMIAEQHGELIKKTNAVIQRQENNTEIKNNVWLLNEVVRSHTERIEALEAKAQ